MGALLLALAGAVRVLADDVLGTVQGNLGQSLAEVRTRRIDAARARPGGPGWPSTRTTYQAMTRSRAEWLGYAALVQVDRIVGDLGAPRPS